MVVKSQRSLKRKLTIHLKSIGFFDSVAVYGNGNGNGSGKGCNGDKETVKKLHAQHRLEKLRVNSSFLTANYPKLTRNFASGAEVSPSKIRPIIQRVYSNTWESDLFRLASLTWSVPVSNGFGRRLRYLVWDESNGKLMGLIAIGDPVFNLSVRDNYIGWNVKDRERRLVNVLDAYVLGSLPPYNLLLGGKVVACLLRSRDIYNDFREEYGKTKGIISGEDKSARLLAVTTSSSMGRSSVYNRLKLNGVQYLKPLGYTRGWGHFHIPDLIFDEMREYLRIINHPYADLNRFGEGPNWKFRTARAALDSLGYKSDFLRHGIERQVFMSELADNTVQILRKGTGRPKLSTLVTVEEIGELARARWIIPRSLTRTDYVSWRAQDIKLLLAT